MIPVRNEITPCRIAIYVNVMRQFPPKSGAYEEVYRAIRPSVLTGSRLLWGSLKRQLKNDLRKRDRQFHVAARQEEVHEIAGRVREVRHPVNRR